MNNWQDIQGHDKIKQELQILLQNNKLPHALLFTGNQGIGKSLVAKVLAKALLCQNGNSICNNCPSCNMFDNKNHPDFYYLEPEGKTVKMIKIEQVRKMQSDISLAPYLSNKKVIIINDAEFMNIMASNSLLKTLEEPIGQVFFILITANKEMLLSTILSRTMKVHFAPLDKRNIVDILKDKYNINNNKLELIAKLANGSVKKAIEFIDEDVLLLRQKALDFIMARMDTKAMWSFTEDIATLNRETVIKWASHLQILIRDLLLIKGNINDDLLYNNDVNTVLINVKEQYSITNLFRKLELVEDLQKRLNSNADLKLVIQKFILDWHR